MPVSFHNTELFVLVNFLPAFSTDVGLCRGCWGEQWENLRHKKVVGSENDKRRRSVWRNTVSVDLETHVDFFDKVVSTFLVRLWCLLDFVLVFAAGAHKYTLVAWIRHTECPRKISTALAAIETVYMVVLLSDDLVEQVASRLLADRADFWGERGGEERMK